MPSKPKHEPPDMSNQAILARLRQWQSAPAGDERREFVRWLAAGGAEPGAQARQRGGERKPRAGR